MYKRLSAPISCQIEIGTVCDNNCFHCYNYWRHEKTVAGAQMSPGEFDVVAEKIVDAKVFNVVLTGGEPFMNRKTLLFAAKKLTSNGISFSLNSNLRTMRPDDAKYLKDCGITSILTSVHGPNKETHGMIVNANSAFDETLRGIRMSQEAQIPIGVSVVLSPGNIDCFIDTARMLCSIGIKEIFPTKAACPENCSSFSSLSLSREQVNSFVRVAEKESKVMGFNFDILSAYPMCGLDDLGSISCFNRRCLAGVSTLTVGANGEVRACNHSSDSVGNLFSEDLGLIWDNLQPWRDGKYLPNECWNCEAILLCGGGCRVEAKTHCGSMSALDPYANPKKMVEFMPILRQKHFKSGAVPKKIKKFRVNNFKKRKEDFGGIILPGVAGSPMFLDKGGYAIIDMLVPRSIIMVHEVANPAEINLPIFLSSLEIKGVIEALE